MLKTVSIGALMLVLTAPACRAQDGPPPPPGGMMRPPVFADLDANGDGRLSPDEFAAPVQQRFADMDSDHDGGVSPAEFDAAHSAMHDHGGPPPGGQGGWHHGPMDPASLDADHDGKVSFAEFSARMKQHFDEMDANHDGVLEPGEMPQPRDGDGPPPPPGT